MGDTAIAWATKVWNPVTGCSKISPGCANCYAEALSLRRGWSALPWTAGNAPENVICHEDRLDEPLRWRQPQRVFVCSMSDLFHAQVPGSFLWDVLTVTRLGSQHTYLLLTKRPGLMRAAMQVYYASGGPPQPNLWLGVSIEDQQRANERIRPLLGTPAAVRFVSAEPLLGPVDLRLREMDPNYDCDGYMLPAPRVKDGLHWVIVGGESGPQRREMNLDWARGLRDQCHAAGVAFFFKQASALRPGHGALLDGQQWHQFPNKQEAE